MVKLFEPLTIRGVTIKNRIWLPPMCQFACEDQTGNPNPWHLVNAGTYAAGGAGLVMVEATAVSPEGRITAQCVGIWNDHQRNLWKPVTAFVKQQGAVPAIQLAHAGRKASDDLYQKTLPISEGGWETIGPSVLAVEGLEPPREMTKDDIARVTQDFADAAQRSIDAGFEVIEIHAAHGYLIHQFLSPLTNKRTDIYGGELENRARILIEIVEGIRAEVGEGMPILIRFSATDYVEGGWDEEQTSIVAKWCAEAGADLFDISTGGLVTGVKIPSGPGYQVPIAEYVAERVDEPVAVVGQITTAAQAEEILQRGNVDVIMLGRAELRDPMWPLRAAHELGVEVDYWPKQYSRGKF